MTNAFQRTDLKYGLIAGVSTIAYLSLFYFWDKVYLFKPLVYWSSLLFYLVFMVQAVRSELKYAEVRPGTQQLIRTAFVVFLIANFIFYLWYFLLFKYDPSLEELLRDLNIRVQESLGVARPEDLKNVREADYGLSFGKVFLAYAYGAFGGFLFSVLIAYVLKKPAQA